MAEPMLACRPPLGGYNRRFGDTRLVEITGWRLLSVGVPRGGADAIDTALELAAGVRLPAAGGVNAAAGAKLLGMAPDLGLAVAEDEGAFRTIGEALGDIAYLTDQSDGWAVLRLEGPATRAALERICMLDLDPDAFPVDKVARTLMDHLSVVIFRDGGGFVLMSAASSAGSFLHAVETSVLNVL